MRCTLLTFASLAVLGAVPARAQQEVFVDVDLASAPALAARPLNRAQFETDLKTELAKHLKENLRYWEFKPAVGAPPLPKVTVSFRVTGTREVVVRLLVTNNQDVIGPFEIIGSAELPGLLDAGVLIASKRVASFAG